MGARVTQAICKLEAAERPIPDDRKADSMIVWGHGWYNVQEDGIPEAMSRTSQRRLWTAKGRQSTGRSRQMWVSRRQTTKGHLRENPSEWCLPETDYKGPAPGVGGVS
ncbi:hypothetical protein BGX38DRAFT_1278965 [Terfezia claveryi]|nr:hypothetical protein BGX38DRAFT_1278965 [Terfezia claveryi]